MRTQRRGQLLGASRPGLTILLFGWWSDDGVCAWRGSGQCGRPTSRGLSMHKTPSTQPGGTSAGSAACAKRAGASLVAVEQRAERMRTSALGWTFVTWMLSTRVPPRSCATERAAEAARPCVRGARMARLRGVLLEVQRLQHRELARRLEPRQVRVRLLVVEEEAVERRAVGG